MNVKVPPSEANKNNTPVLRITGTWEKGSTDDRRSPHKYQVMPKIFLWNVAIMAYIYNDSIVRYFVLKTVAGG